MIKTNDIKLKVAAIVMAVVVVASTTGCTSQATIAALVNTLGSAAASVATIENNPTLAAKLQTDTAAASAAVLAWKKGTPAQNAIEALNLVEDDLSLFVSLNPTAVALIDLAIGTVDSILALLPQSTTANVTVARKHVFLAAPPKNAKNFKSQWNKIAAGGGMQAATIK